ncbi:MAG: ribosome silencing factor [Nitrospirae bacterium]|nr:MAG: ribosome silencing factor [Nitrospirota bacterium]
MIKRTTERQASPLTSREIALKAARAALGKKAGDPLILDLGGLSFVADYFVICSGDSTTQVRAIAEAAEEELSRAGIRPAGIEGLRYCHWVLLDFGDVIVHVFEKETRDYYNLEKLWMDAAVIEIDEDKPDMGRQDKRAVHS